MKLLFRGPPGEKGDTPKFEPNEGVPETIVGPYGLPGDVGDKGDRGYDGRDGSPGEPGKQIITEIRKENCNFWFKVWLV